MKLNQFLYILTLKVNALNWESIGWIPKPSLSDFSFTEGTEKKKNQGYDFHTKESRKTEKEAQILWLYFQQSYFLIISTGVTKILLYSIHPQGIHICN